MKVAVVYNNPVKGKLDSEDVLDEVKLVVNSIKSLGYKFKKIPVDGKNEEDSIDKHLSFLSSELKKYSPDVIFNLIEEFAGKPSFQYHFPLLFDSLNYKYTGSGHEAIRITNDKVLSKKIMNGSNILTPSFQIYKEKKIKINVPLPCIVKPFAEHASVGINDSSVFYNYKTLKKKLPKIYQKNKQSLIIEQFIDGREFNISLLETSHGHAEVLPPAEMLFKKWPKGKPKILGYKSKWNENSFEYNNTKRRFNSRDVLSHKLKKIALKCWDTFKLKGYARVDMRVGLNSEIFVIEINTNPCISSDSGFISAVKKAGYKPKDAVNFMIRNSLSLVQSP